MDVCLRLRIKSNGQDQEVTSEVTRDAWNQAGHEPWSPG